jgi:arylsulfatase A-like enzyme
VAAAGFPALATPVADSRPNIIFLMADDLRYDQVGFMGDRLAVTPHLDLLATRGTVFRHTYVTTSICMTSRASVFSGQYARRHGVNDFSTPLPAESWAISYPILLRQAGYQTAFIGKFGIGHRLPREDWDYWGGFPGHGSYFYTDPATGERVHATRFKTDQMLAFIRERDPSRPFHVSVSFKAPHSEDGVAENHGFRPDPFFDDFFAETVFPKPRLHGMEYYERFPPAFRIDGRGKENEAHVRYQMRFRPDRYQTTTRAIYRLNTGMDYAVGRLVHFLRSHQLDGNTIIFFTSDNGYYMGERGLEGKWYGHDDSIRVPLLVFDPRDEVPPGGRVVEEMALNIDLSPTILAYAGIPIPEAVQGRPLQPLMQGETAGWRTEFFYEHTYDPGTYPVYLPHTIGVVRRDAKYMLYYAQGGTPADRIHEEFFRTAEDPDEEHNLIGDPRWQELIGELRARTFEYTEALR